MDSSLPADRPAAESPSSALPLPRLAVRVGVTGHRDPLRIRDPGLLRPGIRGVLEIVAQTAADLQRNHGRGYASGPPLLRVVSPLAEGADRLVAQEALDMGFELECPLPFPQAEYEKTFDDPSLLGEFHELLGSAVRVLELDGELGNRDPAYEATGRMVLRHCDVLIAVWDGEKRHGTGGTAQIVAEAALLEIPVVWIDPKAERPAILLLPDGSKTEMDQLPNHLNNLFALSAGEETDHLLTYLRKPPPRRRTGRIYDWFRRLVLIGERPDPAGEEPDPPFATHAVSAHFKHADALADNYAGKYRNSFLLIYGLASWSVAAAAAAAVNGALSWLSAVELLLIGTTLCLAMAGRRRHWHRHWSEYRLLGEHLRHAQFLRPLGRVASSFRVPAHAAADDPVHSWEYWLFRALVREAGMMGGRMDQRLEEQRTLFGKLISHQLRYHERTAHTYQVLHRRLHGLGLVLFALTIAASGFHLYEYAMHRDRAGDGSPTAVQRAVGGNPAAAEPHEAGATAGEAPPGDGGHEQESHFPWASFLAVVFPAFGAALVGIESQGEFSRIAHRSAGMKVRLESYGRRLAAPSPPWADLLPSGVVGEAAESAAEAMRAELMDWRVIFSEKPLRLPG